MKRRINWLVSYFLLILFICCGKTSAQSIQVTGSLNCEKDQNANVACRKAEGGELLAIPLPPTRSRPGLVTRGVKVAGLQQEFQTVRGEPYQAEAVTTIKQTLANGTHINQTITAKVGRDAEGRTFRSQKLGLNGPFLLFRGVTMQRPARLSLSLQLSRSFPIRLHMSISSMIRRLRLHTFSR